MRTTYKRNITTGITNLSFRNRVLCPYLLTLMRFTYCFEVIIPHLIKEYRNTVNYSSIPKTNIKNTKSKKKEACHLIRWMQDPPFLEQRGV